MSGRVLIKLIKDPSSWSQLCREGQIAASGINSDLSEIFILAAERYKKI
jgi:hypothetical protein